jgi:hypothetical protein
LRADRQPVGADEECRLAEPGSDLVGRLDPRGLGGDQAEHDHLVLRHQRSGSKPPERSSSYSSSSRSARTRPNTAPAIWQRWTPNVTGRPASITALSSSIPVREHRSAGQPRPS